MPDFEGPEDFSTLSLNENVLRAVTEKGYKKPSPVQAIAIPHILEGRDIIGASQTGTGKTAAFALPILSLLKRHGALRCLVLEPTRELAQQVEGAFNAYGKQQDLRTTLLHGGVGYGQQCDKLRDGTDIVVATPGRLLDHLGRGTLTLDKVSFLVLDEADRMLDMGFMPDIRRIIARCTNKQRQSMLFSATLVQEIENVASWVLRNPFRITVGGGTSTAETVTHALYPVDERQKFDLLVSILSKIDYRSVIIFCRTKNGADIIARWLENTNHKTAILHSDRSQKERDQAMEGFKSGKVEILVATDIVSRGIDIMEVSHVINYDIPQHCEDYVHRIGRTGRMNNEGDAVTLFTASDQDFLKKIEKFIDQKIERKKIEDFDYKWTPILEEEKPQPKRRNRGYSSALSMNMGRRRR